MDKQHFDPLVKGVREMKRHMAGKRVRGAKNDRTARAQCTRDPRGSQDQPEPVREIDWREPAHLAELGAATHSADRACESAAQDRRIEPEGYWGIARIDPIDPAQWILHCFHEQCQVSGNVNGRYRARRMPAIDPNR